jgi:hypothetical protein
MAAKPLRWLASSSTMSTLIGWFKDFLSGLGDNHLFYDGRQDFGGLVDTTLARNGRGSKPVAHAA